VFERQPIQRSNDRHIEGEAGAAARSRPFLDAVQVDGHEQRSC
jgi:hypothetical protein